MKSVSSKRFRTCFDALPAEIQDEARRAYRLWRVNSYHSLLQFKQVKPPSEGGKPDALPLYSARVMDTGYRALGEFAGDVVVWRWIGTHEDYIRLIRRPDKRTRPESRRLRSVRFRAGRIVFTIAPAVWGRVGKRNLAHAITHHMG